MKVYGLQTSDDCKDNDGVANPKTDWRAHYIRSYSGIGFSNFYKYYPLDLLFIILSR